MTQPEVQLDANKVINSLLGQIAQLSQEKALLQAQIAATSEDVQGKEENVDG